MAFIQTVADPVFANFSVWVALLYSGSAISRGPSPNLRGWERGPYLPLYPSTVSRAKICTSSGVCDATFLGSAIIFKAQDLQDSWFTNMADVPKDILFGVSPNEWTDNSKALAWLERSSGPGSASE